MDNDLQTPNRKNNLALWTGRISECRNSGQSVKVWYKENVVCEHTCLNNYLKDGSLELSNNCAKRSIALRH